MASDVPEGRKVAFEIARGLWDGWLSPEDLANKVLRIPLVELEVVTGEPIDLSRYSRSALVGCVLLGDAGSSQWAEAVAAKLIVYVELPEGTSLDERLEYDGDRTSTGDRVLEALRGLQVTKAATLEFFNEHQHAWPAALDLHWKETHDVE